MEPGIGSRPERSGSGCDGMAYRILGLFLGAISRLDWSCRGVGFGCHPFWPILYMHLYHYASRIPVLYPSVQQSKIDIKLNISYILLVGLPISRYL